MSKTVWRTARREFDYGGKTLVMGILNVTPDSFSDGGEFYTVDNALARAKAMITEGADILDIGGESTRPSRERERISADEEIARVVPIIEQITKRFDITISIDTTKAEVARAAITVGAEIINDISGLRFDNRIAEVAAQTNAGLVLMHLRGTFETMHSQPSVDNTLTEVTNGLRWSIERANNAGVSNEQIALDIGIGFSKTFTENLQLLANLNQIIQQLPNFPLLVGASRKSFIGKILDDAPPAERLHGSTASAAIAAWNGANIVRVHDVRATVETLCVVKAIELQALGYEYHE